MIKGWGQPTQWKLHFLLAFTSEIVLRIEGHPRTDEEVATLDEDLWAFGDNAQMCENLAPAKLSLTDIDYVHWLLVI